MLKNKKGSMVDLFIFMIMAIAILFISAIFIYLGGRVLTATHDTMDNLVLHGEKNASELVDISIGAVNNAYQSLYWISIMLIVGMVISIFIGSYLVTTKPVFFIPYAFITIIAVFVAVGLSNAYEQVIASPTLADTFAGFIGGNFIMLNLPVWIAIIGIIGAVIMFVRMGSSDDKIYGGYGG